MKNYVSEIIVLSRESALDFFEKRLFFKYFLSFKTSHSAHSTDGGLRLTPEGAVTDVSFYTKEEVDEWLGKVIKNWSDKN